MEAPYKLRRPKGIKQYIIEKLASDTYLLFNRKEDHWRCTRCGEEGRLSDYMEGAFHGLKTECPACMYPATMKESWRGRKKLEDYGRILWTAKHGKNTYAQLDEYTIDYTGDEPEVHLWESAQYKFSQKEIKYYKHNPGGWYPERWEEKTRVSLPAPPHSYGWWCSKYMLTYLYPELKYGTDLKYADHDLDKYNLVQMEAPRFFIQYLTNFIKYPAIETLEKAGFEKMVAEKCMDVPGRARLNYKQTDLRKIFGLNWGEIRDWQATEEKSAFINHYKALNKKYHGEISFKDIKHLTRYCQLETAAIETVEKHADLPKVAKYLTRQNEKTFGQITIRDYCDYLKDLQKLNLPMDKKHLYPRDFAETHQAYAQAVKTKADELIMEQFIESENEICRMTEPFLLGELMIRPAASPMELEKESAALSHCVRTYKQKVADGRTAILFIRRQSEPDTPYYTLELNADRKIVQCRGKANISMTEEVENFTDSWYKWLKSQKGVSA